MAKDSQIDPKHIREVKAQGGPTHAQSARAGQSNNAKKQSGTRQKPNSAK